MTEANREEQMRPSTDRGESLLSVIVPAYNEADNLPILYQRLVKVLAHLDVQWDLIVVDDHSTDNTFSVVQDLARHDPRVRGYRFSRNFGSHIAIFCGLDHAEGECAVVLAADLQDPPEIIPELLSKWREGAQVVWAVREKRQGESLGRVILARVYYALMRHVVGLKEISPTGADFFLIDREVIHRLREFSERHINILALLAWMGFRQATVSYAKQPRLHGRSGWSLEKKLKLVADSITAFGDRPVRLLSYVGIGVVLMGFLFGLYTAIRVLSGVAPPGWAVVMIILLILGGAQLLGMGMLGEYVWRALDEARHRPRYLIEKSTEPTSDGAGGA
jgi:dolichol-phosphate mannosyltransferase